MATMPIFWWRRGWVRLCAGGGNTRNPQLTEPNNNNNNDRKSTTVKRNVKRHIYIDVILQYPYVLDKASGAMVPKGPGKKRPATVAEVQQRQEEYHYAMRQTLQHPAFDRFHVLLNRSADLPHFETAVWRNLTGVGNPPTVYTHVQGRQMTYGDAFAYANSHAGRRGRYILLLNSDVYPVGTGWMDLRPRHFGRDNRTVFMLSRHSPRCPAAPDRGLRERPEIHCQKAAGYGSADGFLFRAPVPASVVQEMREIPTNYWGAENRAAAAMQRSGYYRRFFNPCLVLKLWHAHCSRVRISGAGAPRVNGGRGNSVTSRFITKLPS